MQSHTITDSSGVNSGHLPGRAVLNPNAGYHEKLTPTYIMLPLASTHNSKLYVGRKRVHRQEISLPTISTVPRM